MLTRLQNEMKKALKEKQTERLNVVRMLISQIKNEAFVVGKQRSADEMLLAYQKKLEKAKNECGGNENFIKQMDRELAIVAEFAPKQMTREEVIEFIRMTYAAKPTMKEAMADLKGKADGKLIADILNKWEDLK